MTRLVILTILIFTSTVSYGQKLTRQQQDSIKLVMNKIGTDDQKYRWQLMLGELDSIKLDSLKKLPDNIRFDRIKKVLKQEIGFSKVVKDSITKLQDKIDSTNNSIFFSIITKYGYPSFKRVGSKTTSYLTLHLADEKNFAKLFQTFNEELLKGNMPATDYAAWFDRCQLSMKKKQLYGQYNQKYPCVDNLEQTNNERKKIGLKKLKNNNCN